MVDWLCEVCFAILVALKYSITLAFYAAMIQCFAMHVALKYSITLAFYAAMMQYLVYRFFVDNFILMFYLSAPWN